MRPKISAVMAIDALGDGNMVRAVRAGGIVIIIEMHAHADRARLLTVGKMHLARHRALGHVEDRGFALHIDAVHHPLIAAREHHMGVHPEELFPGRVDIAAHSPASMYLSYSA